jgi:hypothetical protein
MTKEQFLSMPEIPASCWKRIINEKLAIFAGDSADAELEEMVNTFNDLKVDEGEENLLNQREEELRAIAEAGVSAEVPGGLPTAPQTPVSRPQTPVSRPQTPLSASQNSGSLRLGSTMASDSEPDSILDLLNCTPEANTEEASGMSPSKFEVHTPPQEGLADFMANLRKDMRVFKGMYVNLKEERNTAYHNLRELSECHRQTEQQMECVRQEHAKVGARFTAVLEKEQQLMSDCAAINVWKRDTAIKLEADYRAREKSLVDNLKQKRLGMEEEHQKRQEVLMGDFRKRHADMEKAWSGREK